MFLNPKAWHPDSYQCCNFWGLLNQGIQSEGPPLFSHAPRSLMHRVLYILPPHWLSISRTPEMLVHTGIQCSSVLRKGRLWCVMLLMKWFQLIHVTNGIHIYNTQNYWPSSNGNCQKLIIKENCQWTKNQWAGSYGSDRPSILTTRLCPTNKGAFFRWTGWIIIHA